MTTLSTTELDELIEQVEEQCKNQRCIDSHSVKILLETLRQKIDAEQSLLRAIANSAELLGQALDRLDVPERLLDDLEGEPEFFGSVYYPANAHLIAAAPDMYEALEMAILEYGKPGGPWNVPSSPGSWIDKAKAAIVKARGET